MRIAIFCHKFWPAVSGLCTYTGRLAEYLAERGHQVHVFTTKIPPSAPASEHVAPALVVRRFRPRLSKHIPFFFMPGLLAAAPARSFRQADVVHSVGYYFFPSVLGHYLAKVSSTPHVLTPVFMRNPAIWQRACFDTLVGRRMVRQAGHVIVQSDCERELLQQHGFALPSHTVIPFGVDSDIFERDHETAGLRNRLHLMDDEKVLLFVGKIMSSKGAFDCLELAARLVAARTRFRLVMVGEIHPFERQAFLARIRELSVGQVLALTGPLEDRVEIARYYQLADVVLFPSRHEQFGIVAIEAAASGRPVIGTPVGIMQTLVPKHDSGLLHRFGDVEQFTQNVLAVLATDRFRENAASRRREVLTEYAWRRIAEQTERVYAGVVKAANGREPSRRGAGPA